MREYIAHGLARSYNPDDTNQVEPTAKLPGELLLAVLELMPDPPFLVNRDPRARRVDSLLNAHCGFHEHIDDKEERKCETQRDRSRPYISSLLATCMAVVKEDLGRAASEEPVEEESSSATSGESVVGGADSATGEAPVVQESDSAASEGPAPEEAPSEGPVAGGSRPGKQRANGGEIGTSNRRETGKN
jgi:hypothetical protein